MALVWVIGSGGMLGQALVSEITQTTDTLFDPGFKFNWDAPEIANEQIQQAVELFSKQAKNSNWTIYWAAGTGTMHSTEADLQNEMDVLKSLISSLLLNTSLNLSLGTFVFASSAGAIYAGAPEGLITDSTEPAPINSYGKAKLLQEELINTLTKDGQGVTVISCRISTLFGFKSKDGKQQGLIAEMIRRVLANQVVHIYVPLETMRDYISTRDAANQMITLAALLKKSSAATHVKIIASGTSTSIAQILAILKRICKHNLRLVTQSDTKSAQYQRVVQFEPSIKQGAYIHHQSNLVEGISDLLDSMQKHTASGV